MEIKHKCKLCFKSFSNGRALGGHMRSHMRNLPIRSKPAATKLCQDAAESASSLSAACSSEEQRPAGGVAEEAGEEDQQGLGYGLRENPKRSFRFADPEFSFTASVVVQDRGSETESSKNHPTRRRSKRALKSPVLTHKSWTKPSHAESEPVSSISDATTDQDVAFWLMMLSRDKWPASEQNPAAVDEVVFEAEEEETDGFGCGLDFDLDSGGVKPNKIDKYKCETCKKVFGSFQALGGHRASHKKLKLCSLPPPPRQGNACDRRGHECEVCFRVFSSGQALGGHKRSHLVNPAVTVKPSRSPGRCGDNLNLIDLNLPAPLEDEDISHVELSAVSDAEFVNPVSVRR